MLLNDNSKIIKAIRQTAIPEWHKEIMNERLKSIEKGTAVFHKWDDIKDSLFKI